MHELTRTVRFCLTPAGLGGDWRHEPRDNTFAAWPSSGDGIVVYYEVAVTCRGEPNPVTGYLTDIRKIDAAVHDHVLGRIDAAFRGPVNGTISGPGSILRDAWSHLDRTLDGCLHAVRWQLTPFYSISLESPLMDQVLLRQSFDFSAAHRLHVDELDDAQNRATFGKCNNPNGHGHNYRLEVAVRSSIDGGPGLSGIESLVKKHVVDRFDHRHLNRDTAEFADLNPSVEHIARTTYDILRGPISGAGGELDHVVVWETEKTGCRYPV